MTPSSADVTKKAVTILSRLFQTFVLFSGLFVDRLLKFIVIHTPHPAWGGLLQEHRNPGIALSLAMPPLVMAVGLAAALAVIVFALLRELKKSSPDLLPYFFILTGALSNVFDRVRYGAVIDYFTVPMVGLFFNIADLMILGGILLLVVRKSGTIS